MEGQGVIYSPEETVRFADDIRRRIADPEQCSWMLNAVKELDQASRTAHRRGMAKGLVLGAVLGFIFGLTLALSRFASL